MYFLTLLCGVYLGGALQSVLLSWARNDIFSCNSVLRALGWPAGVVVLSMLGRKQSRDMLGIMTDDEAADLKESHANLLRAYDKAYEEAYEMALFDALDAVGLLDDDPKASVSLETVRRAIRNIREGR